MHGGLGSHEDTLSEKIRTLVPISHLSSEIQNEIVSQGELLTFNSGDVIFRQGERDDYKHYLLEGRVSLWWQGNSVRSIDAEQEAAALPLDAAGPKHYTVQAKRRSCIFRARRSKLEEYVRRACTEQPGGPDVRDISADESSNWMLRLLKSAVLAGLPPANIQKILSRDDDLLVQAGDVIVEQGERGRYYYIIEQGIAEMQRSVASGRPVHLADLGPGEAFGEEGLLGGARHSLTVSMRTDGRLKRVHEKDFNQLVKSSLLHRVDFGAAEALVREGAFWIDVRSPEEHEGGALEGAVNVPLALLRIQCDRLDRDKHYVVCSDDLSMSAVGAFLLAERGFDASYLGETMSEAARGKTPGQPDESNPDESGPDESSPDESSNIIPFAKGTASPTMSENRRGDEQHPPSENPSRSRDASRDAERKGDERERDDPQEPVPEDLYADTFTGRKLAELVAEIQAEHRRLKEGVDAAPDPPPGASEPEEPPLLEDLAPGETASAEPPSAAAVAGATEAPRDREREPEEAFSQIMRDLETRLRRYVESATAAERARFEEQLASRVANVKRLAEQQMREYASKIRESYHSEYGEKEQRLQRRYEKLMALASKVTHQKAEIQRARKQLEAKLEAADELHRELNELGETVSRSIGDLEGLMSEDDEDLRS